MGRPPTKRTTRWPFRRTRRSCDRARRSNNMKNHFVPSATLAGAPGSALMDMERTFGARNYEPLPVVMVYGEGAWLWDEHGRRYLDMLSAYSAVSHGHAHPRIVQALVAQAQRLSVTSRAVHNDRLPMLLKRLAELTGLDRALPINTGLEAVETAIKAARKWGLTIKGIADGKVEII